MKRNAARAAQKPGGRPMVRAGLHDGDETQVPGQLREQLLPECLPVERPSPTVAPMRPEPVLEATDQLCQPDPHRACGYQVASFTPRHYGPKNSCFPEGLLSWRWPEVNCSRCKVC